MSFKCANHTQKHHCFRERCEGDSKNYQNYIAPIIKAKQRRPHTTRSNPSIHEHLHKQRKQKPIQKSKSNKLGFVQKASLEQLSKKKEDTQKYGELLEQLQQKTKRINQLKNKIKGFQNQIKHYQQKLHQKQTRIKLSEQTINHLQHTINNNQYPKSPTSLEKPTQHLLDHYQNQLSSLEVNQVAMSENLEKYRLIEKEYMLYRNQSETTIEKLKRQNEQLRYLQSPQKNCDEQINNLKKQLHRIADKQQTPITSVNYYQLQNDIKTLKTANNQLINERQTLLYRIEEQKVREEELKYNLELINRKIFKWSQQYAHLNEEHKKILDQNDHLKIKVEQKRQKNQKEKEQWARIFKQMMREITRLKKQISHLE